MTLHKTKNTSSIRRITSLYSELMLVESLQDSLLPNLSTVTKTTETKSWH